MRRIDEIICHCSATAEGKAFTTDDIRRWHTSPPNNWRDIGYHYVIELDGSIHKGRPISSRSPAMPYTSASPEEITAIFDPFSASEKASRARSTS